MFVWWYWLIGLVFSFGFAWLCATIAAGKGRSPFSSASWASSSRWG